jgi:hypothetical protein
MPQVSDRVAAFLRTQAPAGRLIFALDATMSRQPTWDAAARFQGDMFTTASAISGLEMQLVYFRGLGECRASRWTNSASELGNSMTRIACQTGETQIGKVLTHIRREHAEQAVNCSIFVGDACEESPWSLYDAAAGLGVPMFLFQEGTDTGVETIFRELALRTHGAYSRFDAGAARQLGELLRCVATFAAGGCKALSNLNTESARRLLGQLRHQN